MASVKSRISRTHLGLAAAALSAIGMLTVPAASTAAQAAATTTLTFVAHPDDDLLFMNPDIASDVQAGYNVWVTYLTAGELSCAKNPPYPSCGMTYADQRIQGERAAYARAARVPNSWTFQQLTFGGHPVAVNHLNGTNVHLVFTYIHAAADEDQCGDLYRMVKNASQVVRPIDGRPTYTQAAFITMLRGIIDHTNPAYIRTQSTIGHREPAPDTEHIDHTAGALLVAAADVDGAGNTRIRRDEYTGYPIRNLPDNVWGYWRDEKQAIWNAYKPYDHQMGPTSWDAVSGRQYLPSGRIFHPGVAWVPPGDFNPTC